MNAKEDQEKGQKNGKENGQENGQDRTEMAAEARFKTPNNQPIECTVKPSKAVQPQNKVYGEQVKLNNTVVDNSVKCTLSSRSTDSISNGTSSPQSATSKHGDFSGQCSSGERSKTIGSAVFANMANTKPQNATSNASSDLKHKTVANSGASNLPKPQMHLNLSLAPQSTHVNHTVISVPHNSQSVSQSSIHVNSSISNSSSMAVNSSPTKPSEDIDMKNNVDYASGIEKCPSKVSCSSDSSPEMDAKWTSKGYGPNGVLNNIGSSIGSTSQGTCCFLKPNINGNREIPGPSGLQRNSQREQLERRDSSSGNEGDMSDGEDYCIYTYKGNNDAPRIEQEETMNHEEQEQEEQVEVEGQHQSGRSSPEMDFLEMDFDPGPSCEQDTGDSDLASINEDIQNITLDNAEPEPVLNDLSSGKVVSRHAVAAVTQHPKPTIQNVNHSPQQPQCSSSETTPEETAKPSSSAWIPSISNRTARWETAGLHRGTGCPLRESYGYHSTSGDLISPGNNRDSDPELWAESSTASAPESSNLNSRKVNLSSTLYHRMMAKKLMLNKQAAFHQSGDSNMESELCNERLDGLLPVDKVMLWSEQEATVKQVTQISTSACGATSAINALLALNVSFSLEMLVKGVNTRLREPGASLPRYLLSRSLAGSTHKDLARGISLCTNGAVITKFFPFYPERRVSLSHWLHYWISRGAAPIATLNLQHCGEGCDIPDAWHHQMIFGVGQAGIYLTNPLECLPEQYVWHQLVSPSILLVRRADVLAHWNANTDLTPLTTMGQMWRKLNVLGQVVNMVREAMRQRQQPSSASFASTHIRIPASYQAGIMLVIRADSAAATELLNAEQLPLL